MKRGKAIQRRTSLPRASRWGIAPRRKPKRAGTHRDDPAYKAFVRLWGCFNCHKDGPSEAAHMTLGPNEKGIGLKVHDRQCVPLCGGPKGCHRAWDTASGPFRGLTKIERYTQAERWVLTMQAYAVPDDLNNALELQELGLGRIERKEGAWTWHPIGEAA